jgi:3'-phosphoadenosine 5'-phosphosulfate sulfotransferase (PAPS reductase)/FAD synthetase
MTKRTMLVEHQQHIIVPVSGGKDSQACIALACDRVGSENVLGVHQHTNFDHSVTYAHMDYMRKRYSIDIVDIHSKQYKSVPEVITGKVMVPTRMARMCTRLLKTGPWFKWLAEHHQYQNSIIYLGMRAAESPGRRSSYGDLKDDDVYDMGDISGECPTKLRKIRTQLPIVTWSTPTVFEFLRARGDKINPLYSKGHKRVGCFPCLLSGPTSMALTARDPEGREHLRQVQQALAFVEERRPTIMVNKLFPHDIAALLDKKEADPFGFLETEEDAQASGCSWCNL